MTGAKKKLKEIKEIYVSRKGDRDFKEIGLALEAAKRYVDCEVVIHLEPGIYHEKIVVSQDYVSFMGKNAEKTIIAYDDGALELLDDGQKRGTFRTPTVFIDADHFYACNITFRNEAGQGDEAGQALAVYADGDFLQFEDCRFEGFQDTLFAAPLPRKEKEPGGFRGPKEFAPRKQGRHYYKNCFISGNIDFIFGGATAYFEECEIFMQNRNDDINGYVTAPSTFQEIEYGFVFNKCRFTSNCPPQSAYLGRPWRNYAKAVIMNSQIDGHIKEEGWHDWGKKDAWDTMFFAEYHNVGEGASLKRAPFVHLLTDEEAEKYTRKQVLGY